MTDKRILRYALAFGLLIASAAAVPGTLSAQQRHGDVNGDGVVSALDAQAILTAVVGLPLPAAYVLGNGDSNCDASTGALDAQIVLSFVIGLSTSQHCVGQTFGPGATVVEITPGNDTSLLVNRGIRLRAVLRDPQGFLIERPVTWQTSNADLVTIDSARGDTAWVSNHFTTTGAADASATITAFSDGSASARVIRVFRSYEGIVIIPQRPDTLRQLNGVTNFFVRSRDSLGTLSSFPNALWTTENAAIASVPGAASNNQNVTALTMGNTFLFATSQTNPLVKDSVRLTVRLPALNTCTGTGGTLHGFTTYTTPQTWSPATNPHYLTSTQQFNAGSSLTIEPGTLVCTQGGGFMVFHAGSRLTAIGTVTQPIVFQPTTPTDFWSGIQIGDFAAFAPTAPPDTSILRNVFVARASNGNGAIDGRERHVVLMDSVTLSQSNVDAVTLMAQGSRMIRSRIDTIVNASQFNFGVTLGRGSLEETTIRLGGTASGIQVTESAIVRQVSIIGGSRGIVQNCCTGTARFNDVTITGPQGVALELNGGQIDPASGTIQVTGGAAGVYRGQLGNFGHLFATATAQQTLLNNGRDTVFITGGTLTGVSVAARADLPWVVTAQPTIDTLAQIVPEPGARFFFQNAGFFFSRGGTMNAVGTPANPIRFEPWAGGTFFGLRFDSPGAGPNPALAPTAVSTLSFIRVDSASGQGNNGGVCCFSGAITGADRHRLLIDSAVVRKSHNTAVVLSASGSFLRRSLIDTTGNISSNFTTGQPAVVLGDTTLFENSLVFRSGQNGVYAPGIGARMANVRVVASRGVGIHAENGILSATTTNVRADSANAYPFHGRIENFGILARTGALQTARFLGNTDNLAVITSGSLTRDTVEVIPQLRWQVQANVGIDTLGRLVPLPGARLTFINGGFHFQRGGTLLAVGTNTDFVRFEPVAGNTFFGLRFDSPGAGPNPAVAPVAVSTLSYVRVDSTSGQGNNGGVCCFSAAINGADRHRLLMDSVIVHKAMNNAVVLSASGSYLRRGWIDTTGNIGSNYTTSQAAVALGDTTLLENTLVFRSGQNGVYAPGIGARLADVRVVASRGVGIHAENGVLNATSTNVRADSANAYPFHGRIENFGILARSGADQVARMLGNTDNVAVITSGALNRDIVEVIPQLRWQVHANVQIDTLAELRPQAGARLTFINGGLWFVRGGTMNATGTPGSLVRFEPVAGNTFFGLRFDSPGPGPIPALAPTAVSRLSYVRIDSTSGQGNNGGICCFSAAINGADHHRLEIDSAIVHKAMNSAVVLNAPGSYLRRGWIDTTGNIASLYTTSQPAVGLGEGTSLENSLVARSGYVGVYAPGINARLSNVRIVASLNVGLQADQGTLTGDEGTVAIDSANAYAYYGTIQNLGVLASDASAQNAWLGNLTDMLIVSGGTLVNDTITAMPQLRWRVDANTQFSTNSRFIPQPGALLEFQNGGLWFLNGATLLAQGTAADTIRFRPVPGQTFFGLRFDDVVGAEIPSRMDYVRVDSASGQSSNPHPFCCSGAAVNAGTQHVLHVSNTRIQRSRQGALFLGAPGSEIQNVLVDSTGTGAGLTTGVSAVGLNEGVEVANLTVHRSGSHGVYVDGALSSFTNVLIQRSLGAGLYIGNNNVAPGGSAGLQLSGFRVEDSGGEGVHIEANSVQLTNCNVLRSASHGFGTNAGYPGIVISGCNIEDNLGYGVFNQNNVAPNTNLISATNNFWGIGGVSTPPTPSTGSATLVPNGASLNVNAAAPAGTRFP